MLAEVASTRLLRTLAVHVVPSHCRIIAVKEGPGSRPFPLLALPQGLRTRTLLLVMNLGKHLFWVRPSINVDMADLLGILVRNCVIPKQYSHCMFGRDYPEFVDRIKGGVIAWRSAECARCIVDFSSGRESKRDFRDWRPSYLEFVENATHSVVIPLLEEMAEADISVAKRFLKFHISSNGEVAPTDDFNASDAPDVSAHFGVQFNRRLAIKQYPGLSKLFILKRSGLAPKPISEIRKSREFNISSTHLTPLRSAIDEGKSLQRMIARLGLDSVLRTRD